ncbi:MAG: hypothetical protein K6U75_16725, partial [Firmicutes bacterium]|nr:hypothetical protein [Bacillota bacterium]
SAVCGKSVSCSLSHVYTNRALAKHLSNVKEMVRFAQTVKGCRFVSQTPKRSTPPAKTMYFWQ